MSAQKREVVVVSGARTAIGDYGGSFKDLSATKLGAIAIREAVARSKLDPATIAVGVADSKSGAVHREPLPIGEIQAREHDDAHPDQGPAVGEVAEDQPA